MIGGSQQRIDSIIHKLWMTHNDAHAFAFDLYLRKGAVLHELLEVIAATSSITAFVDTFFKFNPNHDTHNGQFTSGSGGGSDSGVDLDAIRPVYPVETIFTFALGGEAVTAAREALSLAGEPWGRRTRGSSC